MATGWDIDSPCSLRIKAGCSFIWSSPLLPALTWGNLCSAEETWGASIPAWSQQGWCPHFRVGYPAGSRDVVERSQVCRWWHAQAAYLSNSACQSSCYLVRKVMFCSYLLVSQESYLKTELNWEESTLCLLTFPFYRSPAENKEEMTLKRQRRFHKQTLFLEPVN